VSGPRHVLVSAVEERGPLLHDVQADAPAPNLPDAPAPDLPDDLRRRLADWSLARPAGGFASRPELRRHVARGLELARAVARRLGPEWAVRYQDERHRTTKYVCWGCGHLHWTPDAHGIPPHPVDLVVVGEYGAYPLRAEGFGHFSPDDPAAALDLSAALVADLNRWAADVKAAMDTWVHDRDSARLHDTYARLRDEGELLTARVARELPPGRSVTFEGV